MHRPELHCAMIEKFKVLHAQQADASHGKNTLPKWMTTSLGLALGYPLAWLKISDPEGDGV